MTREPPLHSSFEDRRPCRTIARRVSILLACVATACHRVPEEPPPELPSLSMAEVERRVDAAKGLAQLGDEERAIEMLELASGESLDPAGRRAFAKAIQEFRRSRFWRDTPLRTSLTARGPRVRYGESLELTLSITNLGEVPLVLVAERRSLLDWITFAVGERAILDIEIERRECDSVGTRMIERQNVAIELLDDLAVAPGATTEITVSLPIEPRRGMLFGALALEAVLRPVAIASGDDRRYDPLSFGGATVDVVRKEVEPWFDIGIAGIERETEVLAKGRPEALLLAIAGLQEPELREGLDRVVRSLPGLDPARLRLAIAAIAWCLGQDVPGDPVSLLSWWDAEGVRIDGARMRSMRYGDATTRSRWFAGGVDPEYTGEVPIRENR